MALQVTQISLELIRALRPLVPRIKQRDRSLADQLVRAASSITLNLGEAQYSDPGNRRARLSTAAGSAGETWLALQSAEEWGYVSASQTAAADALCRRVIAILWRMTH
jgi:four helix bundle protein